MPVLQLYNTLSRSLEEFVPVDEKCVKMYACGITCYGPAHLGNARPAVVADVLFRVLRRLYGEHVSYARNYTNIDDKIMLAAKEQSIPISSLTEAVIADYEAQMADLGVLLPTFTPKATETIPEIISMIEMLIARGHAYVAAHHVFFDVSSHPGHGRLSGQNLDALREGVRIEPSPHKRSPQDFVLWKPSVVEQPGWESPWGRGRPGWHIECSAMIHKHLGTTVDVHLGGNDLVFPHHEAEIAQSECAHGEPLARYWLHNGMVTAAGHKMSKSVGNVITVADALQETPGEALRYLLLQGHYRQPIDYTPEKAVEAKAALDRIYRAWEVLSGVEPSTSQGLVLRSLLDDLNTADALAQLHQLANMVLRDPDMSLEAKQRLKAELMEGGEMLGLLMDTQWFKRTMVSPTFIREMIARREEHRRNRDWASADLIRKELADNGVVLEDLPGGTTWRAA